jgi:hypothetical protein
MFSDIAKVFSKNFLIGYFLPSLVFVTILAIVTPRLYPDIPTEITDVINNIGTVLALTTAMVFAWIIGITLLAINRNLIRMLEGYYILNHTFFKTCQQKKFFKLKNKVKLIGEDGKTEKDTYGKVSFNTEREYTENIRRLIVNYPSSEEKILATSFGNTIRSFEMYSYEVYGIDSIVVWPRLWSIIPNECRETVNNSKSYVDLGINLFFLSIVLISLVLTLISSNYWGLLVPLVCMINCFFSYYLAVSSARQWGETVKAVFDIYRYDLLDKMRIEVAKNWKEERDQWMEINKTFLYQNKPNSKLKRGIPS